MIFEIERDFNLALNKESPFVSLNKKEEFNLKCPKQEGFQSTKYNICRSTLPYKVQSEYELLRDNSVKLKVIVMENDFLLAEFLPSFGGRLIRLYDKVKECDLVFFNQNPSLSNIALCNAWFAGGIEFNIGSLGHHRDTSREIAYKYDESILYFENIARRERQSYSLYFKLVDDVLALKVDINNLSDEKKELYWWTNIATECKKIDISSHKGLLRIEEDQSFVNFDLDQNLDYLDPNNINLSTEYFMNCSNNKIMWESVELNKNCTFYEMGTKPLNYRKLFCWGVHQGGNQWNDFLVGKGNRYIEIQSGLAPTQMHTTTIDKTISFRQVFTSNFEKGKQVLEKDIFNTKFKLDIPFLALDNFLHKKSKKKIINNKTKYYYDVIEKKEAQIPCFEYIEFSVDMDLIPYLEYQNNWYSYLQIGVIYFENDHYDKAIDAFKKSIELKETVLAYHLLSESDKENAIYYYEKACNLEGKEKIYYFYSNVLLEKKDISKLDLLFKKYEIKSDFDTINYIRYLELKNKKDEINKILLNRKWVNIIEGSTILSDIYQRVNKNNNIPISIDFRLS